MRVYTVRCSTVASLYVGRQRNAGGTGGDFGGYSDKTVMKY